MFNYSFNMQSLSFIRAQVTNCQPLFVLWSSVAEIILHIATDSLLQHHGTNPYRMPSQYPLFIDHFYSNSGSVNVVCSCSWHFTAMITIFSNNPPRCFVFISCLSSSSFASSLYIFFFWSVLLLVGWFCVLYAPASSAHHILLLIFCKAFFFTSVLYHFRIYENI